MSRFEKNELRILVITGITMAARFIQLLCSLCMLHFFGSLHGATGEVHEGVVYTDLHKTAKKGDEIVLKCKFYETPIGVYWKKRDAQDRGTNLITWVEGQETSGSCANSKACHMSSNYSLVIRDARIEDQGRYACRVSINVGILIYNYTDVKIYAPPKEPYPVIDKCAEKESSGYNSTSSCRILTNTTIIITCSATNYYPELDLVFLHGSQKMTNIMPSEKINSDETKNKSISIKASPSETSYVCVASGIPGSKDPRAATILVESSTVIVTTRAKEGFPTPFTSIAVMTDKRSNNRAAKIGVPIVLILIGVAVLFAFLWWKHPRLFCRTPTDDCKTGKNGATTSNPEERIPMVEPGTIAELRENSNTSVSDQMLEHILWHISGNEEMGRFLQNLTSYDPATCLDISREKKDIIKDAMEHLVKWKQQRFDENPIALLSLALEKTGCSPVDRSFFTGGNEDRMETNPKQDFGEELRKMRISVGHTGHETSLADEVAVASSREGRKTKNRTMVSEKLGVISPGSNIKAVLKDWKAMVHPSTYDQRTSLAEAVFPALGKDVADPIHKRKYRGDEKESSEVIKTISTTIKNMLGKKDSMVQDERLTTSSQAAKLLGESVETETDNRRQDEPATALTISEILGVSIADRSIRQVLATWEKNIRDKPLNENDRKELSNKLLRAGFKQFALEIMTGFVSRPRNKPNRV